MAALYYIANVGPKIRLIASLVRLSEGKAIIPKYSDKIRHFGSTALVLGLILKECLIGFI